MATTSHPPEWSGPALDFVELGWPDSSPELLAELLDPASWRGTLETYARTVKVAVAMTDLQGRQRGMCLNPQPTWRLVCDSGRATGDECSFCLAPAKPCTAVVEAVQSRSPVVSVDQTGLAHVAVPLILGNQALGALVAGQVFTRYPEPLGLQRVAKSFGIPSQKLWNQAIKERPLSPATLLMYGNLLMSLGGALLGNRFAWLLQLRLVEANITTTRSLEEKEVLLGEIQHRVKNNLQIIASLLNLQSNSLDDVIDARAVEALRGSQQRVATMAQIHNFMYEHERIGDIDLAEYLQSLAEMAISASQGTDAMIHANFTLAPALLSMRQAIPCGLIVNELITNVFKHAYPNDAGGVIDIIVNPVADDMVSFTIADHGIGIAEGLDWRESNSLGLRIVRVLTQQLGGTLELDRSQGTAFTLRFKKEA